MPARRMPADVGDRPAEAGLGVLLPPFPGPAPNRNLKKRELSCCGSGGTGGKTILILVGLVAVLLEPVIGVATPLLPARSSWLLALKLRLRPSESNSEAARAVFGLAIAADLPGFGVTLRWRSVDASRSLYRFHPTSFPALAPPDRFSASSSISLFARSSVRLDLAKVSVVSRSCWFSRRARIVSS